MVLNKCPECGNELTQEMIDANMCWECGRIIDVSLVDDEIREEFEIREKKRGIEAQKQEYAKSFNEHYEYDVVSILNEDHGRIDKEKIMKVLSEHSKSGWKLHTMYSNELGKNAVRILGLGTNSTACEDILVFERRVESIG